MSTALLTPRRSLDQLSIVVPVLNEERNIEPLTERIDRTCAQLAHSYELILVDDGSTDGTAQRVAALRERYPQLKLVRFSRNFGHQAALTAGMDVASGDAVVVMDADLQHPPEVLGQLVARWMEGYDVVYTVRQDTEDASLKKRATSWIFYKVFRVLSSIDMPANSADFRLIDRKVADAFRSLRERTRFLRGLTSWVGYPSIGVPFRADARLSGQAKYGFRRMLRLALDGVISFSAAPLYAAIYAGLAISSLGFLYAVYVVYARFFTDNVVPGWASLVVFGAFVAGLQLTLMGMIGVYVGRIYEEVKQRPLYLVHSTLGFREDQTQDQNIGTGNRSHHVTV